MALRATVTDIASVDEAIRDFYVEKDGKFLLNVEKSDGFNLENVDGLTTALGKERNARSQLEERLKAYGDLDPNAARDALNRVTEYADLDPVKAREAMATAERFAKFDPEKEADRIAEEKLKNSKTQITSAFERKEAELVARATTAEALATRREKQVEDLMKRNTIKSELVKAKPIDDVADMLERQIAENVRLREVDNRWVIEVLDESGAPRIKDYNGTPMTVSDYVAELREKKPSLFQPDNTSGAGVTAKPNGASRSDTKNPWVKGPNFSVTQQMILMNKDPQAARRFMSEAGA